MNAIELAKAAERAAAPYRGILSAELLSEIKLAYIARWIDAQDESTPAITVLHRAREAMASVRANEFAEAA